MKRIFWFPVFVLSMAVMTACSPAPKEDPAPLGLSETELHDKILGMLVGSAIGDAMGAPTEMWSREAIVSKFGFVTGLDSVIRDVSPEGVWIKDLPPGGTTDDTRWKKLAVEYLIGEAGNELDARVFSQIILQRFDLSISQLTPSDSLDSVSLAKKSLPILWLHEWQKAARPFVQGNLIDYQDQLSTFYGGEMVCAGLLYAPAIGAFFPENPEKSYSEAFKLSIFDIGYARDITALSAAWTSLAMTKDITADSMLRTIEKLDPMKFSDARLVGRTAAKILDLAKKINLETKGISDDSLLVDSVKVVFEWKPENLQPAFLLLDKHLQDMPFHAGEIYLQVLTAMLVADFDFEKTLQFLVNYGRDNDTTAAVAGAILGAYYGFDRLPEQMKKQVIKVNKERLGIDLEELAEKMGTNLLGRYR